MPISFQKPDFSFRKAASFVFIFILISISFKTFTNISAPPVANTGAPGDGNCTSCHTGSAITSGSNWSSIALTGLPASGYQPGTGYTLTVDGSSASTGRNGFQMTVLNGSNAMAGSFTAGSGSSVQTSSGRSYIGHSSAGSQSSWTFTWTAPSPGVGTVTFYLAFNGSNSNSASSGDAIYLKNFSLIQFSNLPTAVITPSSTTICQGDTLTLQGSGINDPTSWSWQMNGGTPSSATTQNTKVVYNTSGLKTITLTTTNSFGSSSPAFRNITVIAKPTATFSASSNIICGEDSVTLTANTGVNLQYLWTPGNLTGFKVNVLNAGTYRVKVTNASNCSNLSSPQVISKGNKPLVQFTTDKDSICPFDSVQLRASGTGKTYAFYKDTALLQNKTDSIFYYTGSLGSDSVYVIAKDSGCETKSAKRKLNVIKPLQAPILSCGNRTATSVEFNWLQVQSASSYEVSVDSGKNWAAPTGSNGLSHMLSGLSPNSKVTILVRAAKSNVCSENTTGSVTCQAANCPALPVTISFSKHACSGDSGKVEIAASVPNDGKKYSMSLNGGTAQNVQTIQIFQPQPGDHQYHLRIADSSLLDCPFDTLFSIPTLDLPQGNLVLTSNNPGGMFCLYDSILELRVPKLKSANHFIFSLLDSLLIKETILKQSQADTFFSRKINQFTSGKNTMLIRIVNDSSGCQKTSLYKLNRLGDPGASFLLEPGSNPGSVKLTDQTTEPLIASRHWSFGDGGEDSIAKVVTHQYLVNGSYPVSLMVLTEAGCLDTAKQTAIINNAGIDEPGIHELFIFPNPAHDLIHLELKKETAGSCILYDLTGKKVIDTRFTGKSLQLSTEGLNAQVYLMVINTGDSILSIKIMIE